jgi:DNA-binding transcriptional MerR regulator
MQSYVAAGILALAIGAAPALAQSSQSAPASQTAEKPAQKPQAKAKKVWTDDDIAALRTTAIISTASATPAEEGEKPAGEAGSAPAKGKEKEIPPEKTAKYYTEKLVPLRKQLAETEAKIKEIQDALANPSKGTDKVSFNQPAPSGPQSDTQSNPLRPDNSLYGNQIVRPQDQLTYYEKLRDDLQQKIDALEAQAISNGLTRGEIQ